MKKDKTAALATLTQKLVYLLEITVFNAHVQSSLNDVFRWGMVKASFWRRLFFPSRRIRKQSDLQHSYAMTILLQWAVAKLKPHNPELDGYLLVCCAANHDLGEGETKKDVCALTKQRAVDAREFIAVRHSLSQLSSIARQEIEKAFLLQFADVEDDKRDEAWRLFPHDAQIVLRQLAENRRVEARLFKYMEKFEYILYAIEQATRYGNFHLAAERKSKKAGYVFISHKGEMEKACQLIPGFREEIWTSKVMEIVEEFIQVYNQKAAS